jgi:hypothetical protein
VIPGFALIFLALLVAHWFPLPAAHHTAAYIGRFYRDHTDGIRLGAVLLTAGAALLAPIGAVTAVQMKRIEGQFSPLTYLAIGMSAAATLAITVTSFFWWTAAYRPDRDPVVTQSWNDAGWLCITAVIFIFNMWLWAFAAAVFTDKRDQPLFPRWLGYLTVWATILLFPSLLCIWLKSGAFAWNGVASLYLAFVAVGVWFGALIVNLLRVIREHERELMTAERATAA